MSEPESRPLIGPLCVPLKDNIRLKIEYVPIGSLQRDPKTARSPASKTQKRKLEKSINQFGPFPVITDAGLKLVDGHEVWQAAVRLGYKVMPVIKVEHLSPAEIQLLGMALNSLANPEAYNERQLGINFRDILLDEPEIDLESSGLEMGKIDFLIEALSQDLDSDPDPADEILPPGPAVCQPNDLWQLGKHRLLCATALEGASFETLMQGESADVVITDPPFNVPVQGHVCGKGNIRHREFAMASGEMSEAEFTDFLTQACSLLAHNSRSGVLHFICMDWRHVFEMMTAGRAAYDELKNICVWVKDNGGMGSLYRSQHELVFVFKHGKAPHRNNVQLGRYGRNRTNVWSYPGANSLSRQGEEGNLLAMHPTVKPVQMIADALLDCSARGDIVLDSFLGSGTTLLAAERVGRVCYGMEIDALYVDTAIRRWQKQTGEQAVHAETGKTFDEIAAEVSHG